MGGWKTANGLLCVAWNPPWFCNGWGWEALIWIVGPVLLNDAWGIGLKALADPIWLFDPIFTLICCGWPILTLCCEDWMLCDWILCCWRGRAWPACGKRDGTWVVVFVNDWVCKVLCEEPPYLQFVCWGCVWICVCPWKGGYDFCTENPCELCWRFCGCWYWFWFWYWNCWDCWENWLTKFCCCCCDVCWISTVCYWIFGWFCSANFWFWLT